MIGIIGAVIEEAEAIKKEINDIKENTINGISFFTGKFNDKEVVFVQSGIGKVNAAITATLLIEKTGNITNFEHQILLGRILTGDQFVSKKDVKIQLGKDFEALCVDMESGAVAQVCTRLGVKFLIIRSISDSITDESDMEYETFVKLAAENSKEILKKIIN